ncbi:MAG: MaoC family dehydratase N-terminal domain-containing protein [Desulfobacteraceae bacterium]|nr:MaoC family dehydratase N-terminal domain-containing protein [Desulfobacteraceae bacterium]
MRKAFETKYLEDFEPDEGVESFGVTITEAHLVAWAGLTYDHYPLHMDQEFASNTVFGGRIVHGPFLFAISIGLAGINGFVGDAIIAWLGVETLRVPRPTRIGDTVKVRARVKEKRKSDDPEKGILVLHYEVVNQRDEVVLHYDNLLMYPSRNTGGTS